MSTDTQPGTQPSERKPRRWLTLLPLALFLVLAGLFLAQLVSGRDSSVVPSALIGAQAPQVALPPLEGVALPGLDPTQFAGKVTLVNVWASWCGPCRQEHPFLMELAKDERITVVGLNYKDRSDNARRFLGDLGNPYAAIGVDDSGRAAIDWGVYGVPETFVVDAAGVIIFKHVGPLTPKAIETELLPAIERARG